MKINKYLKENKITLSFEVFPPKADSAFENVKKAAYSVAQLKPDYMSVTYGAGGSTSNNTLAIAEGIQNEYGVTAIAHLTCVGASKESIQQSLENMKNAGIENVLALRGDKPEWMNGEPFTDYHYASDLAEDIRKYGGFCIGGACYPEGHPDSSDKNQDMENLKKKIDAGCEFLTTQMFFDNNTFYDFKNRAESSGIKVPIIPGIMPITRASQAENVIRLSGCRLPQNLKNIIDRFADSKDALQQAGIIYASNQIIDLIANDIRNIHIYSMNNAEVVKEIRDNFSEVIKG